MATPAAKFAEYTQLARKEPEWKAAHGLEPVLDGWLRSERVRPCFAAERDYESSVARTVALPDALHPNLKNALRARGIDQLYTHQARAFEIASKRKPFVVATPTASGKSLCFHLPVLDALLRNPDARALYFFPTKALARDQEASVRELMTEAGGGISVVTYDGDTPNDARRAARERSGIVVTNPDMLHSGVLPHHTAWARTFQALEFVVVDELHTYRGVFGSHVANVIRRLMRVARFHGSHPTLIGATATIGNPRAHAARLFGRNEEDVELVDDSGAPRGERKFFFYNPPVVNEELGIRASYVKQTVALAADLVRAKVPTIVFGSSRNSVEMMLRYLREKVSKDRIEPERIMAYRGGYLPEQRRDIERRLRSGEILCVVATNALELGIDVGGLDAVVCASYPGSVAAMWQRFGRAGRRGALSICVLVACSAPLDQFLAREPEYLLGASVEEARIDPDNIEVLVQHLKCAAFELPFKRGDGFGSLAPDDTSDALDFLASHRVLHESGGAYHWAADAYPANEVSLRSVGWDNVVIVDLDRDKVLAELDWPSAHTMLHEQAIYQHDAGTWQVERFDHENHKAYVREVAPDYFTTAMTHTKVSILEEEAAAAPCAWGEVSVVTKVVGYKKIKFQTHENTGYGEVHLPEMQMHTTAFWLKLGEDTKHLAPPAQRLDRQLRSSATIDGLRGLGIALETVATFSLMCDARDIGMTVEDERHVENEEATLFLYEHVPGGTGLAERIFALRKELFSRALKLVTSCTCGAGCPACVGPAETSGERKRVAAALLEVLVSRA
jgi:DEAD/DEAH box helicase domain-containing protein